MTRYHASLRHQKFGKPLFSRYDRHPIIDRHVRQVAKSTSVVARMFSGDETVYRFSASAMACSRLSVLPASQAAAKAPASQRTTPANAPPVNRCGLLKFWHSKRNFTALFGTADQAFMAASLEAGNTPAERVSAG